MTEGQRHTATATLRRGLLARLNPLATLGAPLPAIVYLVFSRDIATPLMFLLASLILLFAGTRVSARQAAVILLGLPLVVIVLTVSFTLWVDPERVATTAALVHIGSWTLYSGAVPLGLATALRLVAIISLSLPIAFSTTGSDLARAMVQQLRVPYRVGYSVLAAFRFVPRFAQELESIRAAHRVRGMASGRGPVHALRRYTGYVVPLLAGAIRHAERVALAMDARAFGAHPTRTERYILRFAAPEWSYMILFWALSAALIVVASTVPPT